MQIENIAELAEEIYWLVLKEFNKDNLDSGYIEFENSFLGTTQNTEKGQNLYLSIEGLIEHYMETAG
jgi:hypothetical protein